MEKITEPTSKQLAEAELKAIGITPDSESGREFLLRVAAFGIMGVQPPKPELNQTNED